MQFGERLVEREEVDHGDLWRRDRLVEHDPRCRAAPLAGRLPARVIDQDLPHQPRGHRKQVGAILRRRRARSHQPEIRLVDQRGRLKGVVWLFLTKPRSRHPAQLLVHERQQLLQRVSVPGPPLL